MTDRWQDAPRRWRVVAARVLLLIGAAIAVMCAALYTGMRIDDSRIEANLATATATVLTVSPLRTGVEFIDGTGTTIRPPGGVLYPGLLSVGQQFVVEYSTKDPTIVRVAGRTAAVGIPVIGMTLAGTAAVVVGGFVLLRRSNRIEPPGTADRFGEQPVDGTDPSMAAADGSAELTRSAGSGVPPVPPG